MIEQINVVDRDLKKVFYENCKRIMFSAVSNVNVKNNVEKISNPAPEKTSVKVYDNVGVVKGDVSMEYEKIAPERVPISAKREGARALKTGKIDNIRENGGMKVVFDAKRSNEDNSYLADMKKSLESISSDVNSFTTPGVMSDGNDNSNDDLQVSVPQHETIHIMNGGRDVTKKMNRFDDENKEELNIENMNQERENVKKQIEKEFSPEYGTGPSEVFGETPLKEDDSIVNISKEKPKEVQNTNTLISAIPSHVETHEENKEVHENKEDQLTNVHNKIFGIENEVSNDELNKVKESLVGATSNTGEVSTYRSRLQELSKKEANVLETREANETVNLNLEKTMVNGTKLREELDSYKKAIEKMITDREKKIAQEEAEALRRRAELEESLRKEEDNCNNMQHEIDEFKEIERELGTPNSGMRR